MQVDFLTTFINVMIMVALALPGFVLRKKNMLPDNVVKTLVLILMYASQPFMMISPFLKIDFSVQLLINMAIAFAITLVAHLLIYFTAKLAFSFLRAKKDKVDENGEIIPVDQVERELDASRRAGTVCAFLGNIGFMGIPVMRALFPNNPEMAIYTAAVTISFNILSWSLGIYTITKNKKDIRISRAFINPAILPLVLSIPLLVVKQYIPARIMTPISNCMSYLGDMTLPLSMIIVGIRLAEIPFKQVVSDPKVYLTCGLKLVVSPLITFALCILLRVIFPISDAVLITCYVALAMPSAAMSLNFAELYNGDRKLALKTVLLSTLLSVLTIPLLMLLCAVI